MSGIIGGAGSKSGVIGTTEPAYEEGTWTPTGTNVTGYSGSRYTRLGKFVICHYYYSTTGTASTPLGGLPFTSSTESSGTYSGSGVCGSQNKTANVVWVNNVNEGSTTFKHALGSGGSQSQGNNEENFGNLIYLID